MTSAIEVLSLRKEFKEYKALKDISFSIAQNTVVGFLGPNGAGKTTTLRILTGLSAPTAGKVFINGKEVVFGKQDGISDVGYLPEQPSLYPWMNAIEYLRFMGGLGNASDDLSSKIKKVLETVGLTEAKRRRIAGYSNGMKQRLGIAQAILNNPKVLIFDEPVSALDPIGRREILQLMLQLKKEHTILFSSHILSDVERLCHEVIVINKGEIITQSSVSALKKSFAKPMVQVKFARELSNAELDELKKSDGVITVEQNEAGVEIMAENESIIEKNLIISTLANMNVPIISYNIGEPDLEDVFVNLVTQKK